MFPHTQISEIHLELTENCNAACPMCSRTYEDGSINPYTNKRDITLDDFQKIISEDILKNLKRLKLCGTYGDPIAGRDLDKICSYAMEVNPGLSIKINTNGSLKTAAWWTDFAKNFSKNNSVVVFDLDGLEDTHHLYRRKTSWKKIVENAQAFINAGGRAEWAFLVFKHNEHQVKEAEGLARKWGFRKFNLKKTKRFYDGTNHKLSDRSPVLNKQGEVEYYLEIPDDPSLRHPTLNKTDEERDLLPSIIEKSEIDCITFKERSIYISAEGLVFPCCWFGGNYYPNKMGEKTGEIWDMVEKIGGKDKINAFKSSIAEIMETPFFKSLPESWKKTDYSCGKPKTCSRVCGKALKTYDGQFERKDLTV